MSNTNPTVFELMQRAIANALAEQQKAEQNKSKNNTNN